jgi:DNA-binding response OmpR family regulator
MSANLKVLLIEDDTSLHSPWSRLLQVHRIEAICASSIEEAEDLFEEHKSTLAAISVDGCVPGDELNTLPLIRMMCREYQKPIIAASGDSFYRKQMMEVGCTHECHKKSELPHVIVELLDSIKSSAA